MEDQNQQLKRLEKRRESYVDQMAWFALSLIAIFGVPAGIAAYVGRVVFDNNLILGGLLVLAFFFSWIIVVYRYKKISKKVRVTEGKIKELKEQQLSNLED
jgi:uncharacterized membrane protein